MEAAGHPHKQAIAADLKNPDDLQLTKDLIDEADVLVENFRPGVLERLGLHPDELLARNKKLVIVRVTGFGQTGPYRERGGVDQIAQGVAGLMSITGFQESGPVRVGIPISDLTAGNLLALGIMMALFDRSRTGVGRWVHTSLLESLIFMLDLQGSRYLVKGEVAKQAGNDHPTLTPTGVFPTSDGYMNIAASSGRLWERLCDVLGHSEWKTKPEWTTVVGRTKDRAGVNGAISAVTKTQTGDYWTEKFDAAGIPAGPINTIDRVFNDPQVKHVGMAAPVDSPLFGKTHYVANPLNMTGNTRDIRLCAPEPGQHNDEVLEWLGLSKAEIAKLRDNKVI